MTRQGYSRILVVISAALIVAFISACGSAPHGEFFGKTVPPSDNVLRYITGPEPETLDPQLPDGQPEARIYMAMYEGLVEYDPKDQQPIPALAKSWESSPGQDEFLFHIRDNAKWSDGKPITARDFVYSLRRGFRPDVISRTAQLGYFIKYAEAYKSGHVFLKKNGQYLLNKDLGEDEKESTEVGPKTEFSKFIHSPTRLSIPTDEKEKAKLLTGNPKLAEAIEGAELVPVTAEDIGVEALDDYTLRISLRQSAPFYLGLFAHQFFRLVPEQSVEKNGKNWAKVGNIITNGPFKVKEYRPYDILKLEKDPNYWDAANVHLDGIEFYPIEELSTIMNLYKAGSIDAMQNHAVPSSWINEIKNYKDEYLNFPEMAVAYYAMNMTKPPFDDIRVRRAFTIGLDREALSSFRKVTKPLYYMSPTGIFREYDQALEKVSETKRNEKGVSPEQWAKNIKFDAEQARKLLTDAGFPVQKNGDTYSCPSFPTDKVTLTYNTNESNRSIAEFVQSQWKQHLGITIPLKNMEFKTFMPYFKGLEYVGFAQLLWSGDYVDPYSFLSLEYGKANEGGSGFNDPKFDKMLDDANAELDPQKRYAMVAEAEYYLMEQAPVVPLTVNATNWIKKPYVKGLYPNPGTLFPWKFVYIETDPAKWDKDVANIFTANDPKYAKQLADLKSTQKEIAK